MGEKTKSKMLIVSDYEEHFYFKKRSGKQLFFCFF